MKEIWKDVKGFEGYYQISNHGRLKSFKRLGRSIILSNVNCKGGYFSVVLNDNAVRENIRYTRIHILVAEHFIGERIKGVHVHHKDGNKQNNRVDNLEYILPSSHHQLEIQKNPSIINGLINYNRFIRPRSIVQLDLKGNKLGEFPNSIEASKATGVCSRNIHQVASRATYRHGLTRKQAGGFIWKFKEDVVCN